jgi:hypothetical protein
MTRGPAVAATTLALGLINIGLASLIVIALGAGVFVPTWLALGLIVGGCVAAVIAVTLWRGYVRSLGPRPKTDLTTGP